MGGTHSDRTDLPAPIDLTILWLKRGVLLFRRRQLRSGMYTEALGITRDGKVRRGIEIIRIRYVTEKNEEECQWRIRRRFSRKRKSCVSLR
jgi:hypothetical protein